MVFKYINGNTLSDVEDFIVWNAWCGLARTIYHLQKVLAGRSAWSVTIELMELTCYRFHKSD